MKTVGKLTMSADVFEYFIARHCGNFGLCVCIKLSITAVVCRSTILLRYAYIRHGNISRGLIGVPTFGNNNLGGRIED